jgi:hypothetical protein
MNEIVSTSTEAIAPWTLSLSHGTLETRDIAKARRFYNDFLGLETVAGVKTGDAMLTLPSDIRWCLDMATSEEVDAAHQAALRLADDYGIQEVRPIETEGNQKSFQLADMDGNWWEICYRPERLFDSVFDAP